MEKVFLVFVLCSVAVWASPLSEGARIVGGDDAKPHSAPYMVSLRIALNESDVLPIHTCGGSILSANWVLTAGNCLLNLPEDGQIVIYAGAHDFSEEPTASLQVRTIGEQIIHANYLGGTTPYNIALIRVSEPFVFNEFVQLIALPPKDLIHEGDVTMFGWGNNSNTTTINLPDILQTVTKPIVEFNTCAEVMVGFVLHQTMMCTGPLTGGISACGGDRGGPLVQDSNGDGVVELVGVSVWFFYNTYIPCGRATNSPSGYTRVSAFNDWIHSYIDEI